MLQKAFNCPSFGYMYLLYCPIQLWRLFSCTGNRLMSTEKGNIDIWNIATDGEIIKPGCCKQYIYILQGILRGGITQ